MTLERISPVIAKFISGNWVEGERKECVFCFRTEILCDKRSLNLVAGRLFGPVSMDDC